MEDELVKEALETIKNNIRDSWETSKSQDKEGREEAWKMLKAVNEFERHFRSIMETGTMASHELNRIQGLMNKLKLNVGFK
jgi:signal transduction protein with GAF and PtsI domain